MSNSAQKLEIDEYFPREALFQDNISLVKIIAHHISVRLPPNQSVDDLIQVGMIGLLEASRSYDPTLGAAFKSYASIRIRGSILDELRKQSWMPRSLQKKSRELSQAIHGVENKLGRSASDREIAEEMDMSLDDYEVMLESLAGCTVFSLDDDDNFNEPETNEKSPFKNIQDAAIKEKLAEVIGSLPEQEKLVVSLYYDKELNLREIGEVLDVSESRVCQVHSQAVNRMRARMREWTIND
ncbi:MAG: RNA polymerase sigma factor FliA [SAR86 cluster bacterium]|uniref:RNA polymerase sigma factor FliA n=1 Tax=SAR86 cluster bacterium TaxID=2030880 RepID=A0A2A5CBL5_9GAMM|nr:MAG: RNA polymerase sigma factor FliA [SAR86 cluster bacterium]